MILFAALVAGYASVHGTGPRGLDLGAVPLLDGLLVGALVAGWSLMLAALAPGAYLDSNYAKPGERARPPRGLERITRHPFFAGLVIFMSAHALLAQHLTGTVFAAGFVALAALGAMHQTRKLLGSRPGFDEYVAQSSAVPFLAILRGRQRFVAREIPWIPLLAAALSAYPLRLVPHHVFDFYGAPFFLPFLVGPAIFELVALPRAARRARSRRAQHPKESGVPSAIRRPPEGT